MRILTNICVNKHHSLKSTSHENLLTRLFLESDSSFFLCREKKMFLVDIQLQHVSVIKLYVN